jgi:hypothetical protein
MLFKLNTQQTAIPTTGRNIAHKRRTTSQRAGLAAQLVAGEVVLKPTVTQVVSLLRVSRPYVEIALKATSDRRASLVAGHLKVSQLKSSPTDQMEMAWNVASSAERIEFARRVGVDRIFDGAIAPVIG